MTDDADELTQGLNEAAHQLARCQRHDEKHTRMVNRAIAALAEREAEIARLREALIENTQELERIDRTKATDFSLVRKLIVSNRAALGGDDAP